MSSSVKISQLNEIPFIASADYFPLVQSASQTTYRATFTDFNVWASVFGTASLALSASTAVSASYALTSSLSISASNILTASYAITASYLISSGSTLLGSASHATFADTASYALNATSASYAQSASAANSASVAISASYALSSSYAFSSSYALNSTFAQTASFLAASATVALQPLTVKELLIQPRWKPYFTSGTPILITNQGIVVANAAGQTTVLTGSSQTNDRSNTGLGGILGGFTNQHWYDIFWLYSSQGTGTAGAVTTVITDSGTSPNNVTTASILTNATVTAGGYDYVAKIGSIQDDADINNPSYGRIWRQWYSYGIITTLVYRNLVPYYMGTGQSQGPAGVTGIGPGGYDCNGNFNANNFGLAAIGGFIITHYLGYVPRNIQLKLKLKGASNLGYAFGDEIRVEDTLMDPDTSTNNLQPFGVVSTDTLLKVWRNEACQSWIISDVENGFFGGIDLTKWDVIIIAS